MKKPWGCSEFMYIERNEKHVSQWIAMLHGQKGQMAMRGDCNRAMDHARDSPVPLGFGESLAQYSLLVFVLLNISFVRAVAVNFSTSNYPTYTSTHLTKITGFGQSAVRALYNPQQSRWGITSRDFLVFNLTSHRHLHTSAECAF